MPYLSTTTATPTFVTRMLNTHPDGCCVPGARLAAPAAPVLKRAKLSELDSNIHCSIIGTCLTTGELRKLVPRYAPALDRKTASDLEIHHTAVELSTLGEAAAKELNKALDTRHALALKRFKAAGDETALAAMWNEALAHGDVAGSYWALMTHPLCGFELRRQAFGDVHMLSHLVGASNRADLRRLTTLEDECARLRQQNAQQQARLQEQAAQHHHALELAEHQAIELAALRERHTGLASSAAADELTQLRAALSIREEQLSLQIVRQAETENLLLARDKAIETLARESDQLRTGAELAHDEMHALEQVLAQTLEQGVQAAALPHLHGQRVLYVGGRPQTNLILAKLVAAAGGELLVHDGGIEDRKGMLASMLPRAQLVVFPVDCISHNAMHTARQLAERNGIPCHPVRTAGIASFVELMHRVKLEIQP
jgi:hypothetical protein